MALKAEMSNAGCSMEVTDEYFKIKDQYVQKRHQNSQSISPFVPNIEAFRSAIRNELKKG
jgi:hypothetical protein